MLSMATDLPAPTEAQINRLRFSRCSGIGIGPMQTGGSAWHDGIALRRQAFSRRLAVRTRAATVCQLANRAPHNQRR
jgi:hypothetical protein